MKIMSIDMALSVIIAHLVQIGQWVTGPRGNSGDAYEIHDSCDF